MLPAFLPPRHSGRVSTGLLILRIVLGLAFIQYGLEKAGNPAGWSDKFVPLPGIVQVLVVIAELGGGIGVLFGALTPIAALLIALDMLGVVITFVIPHGGTIWISATPRLTYEKNLMYFAGALALLFTGPGEFSIDGMLGRNDRNAILSPRR